MELLNAVAKFPQARAQDRSVAQEASKIAVLALVADHPACHPRAVAGLGHRQR